LLALPTIDRLALPHRSKKQLRTTKSPRAKIAESLSIKTREKDKFEWFNNKRRKAERGGAQLLR
jgi:hypothetical protein